LDHLESIRQTFFQECEEQLSELESGLLAIEDGNHHSEIINAVFRAVHSIKGGAAAFGYDELVEFVHVFETTLDLLRAEVLTPTPAITKILLHASDVLSDLIRSIRNDAAFDTDEVASTKASLDALCADAGKGGSQPEDARQDEAGEIDFTPVAISLDDIFCDDAATDAAVNRFAISFRPKPTLYARANEALRILREIKALGAVEIACDCAELPLLTELDAEGAYLSWTLALETTAAAGEIEQIFEFVSADCDYSVAPEPAPEGGEPADESDPPAPAPTSSPVGAQAKEAPLASEPQTLAPSVATGKATGFEQAMPQAPQETIRVDLDKIDRLVNLVGELVINQAVLSQRVSEAGLPRGSSVMIGLEELEQLTRDIQDSVMAIRAQPVKPVFQRMSRIVREVAALTRKSVRLVVDGEGTEVDKTVIERLTDPLTHMVRNAVDHGIESPEARIAAGKPEEGSLRLSAMHRSGRIVIEVTDDGAGIDRARVREIAVRKGLIAENAVLSDDETDALIFLPGFSTNTVASSISGRGVGMDVVKRAIQALGGRISIASRQGRGSTFSMSLPLTLAVLDGMVVHVAGQILVLPLTAVIETLQPRTQNIHCLSSGLRVISNRKSFIPLIDVGLILSYRTREIDPTTQVALLVESESGEKCALLVDAIQGQRQVVIKSLESNYGKVPGIAAATILGDGRVALIVDVDAVLGLSRGECQSREAELEPA
jgi:two-component system chemotaxis sensor kinase CheA